MNTDKITTWLGALAAGILAFNSAIEPMQNNGQINWVGLAGAVIVAFFGYFTNKSK